MFGCDKYSIKPDLVSFAKVKLDIQVLSHIPSQFSSVGTVLILCFIGPFFGIYAHWSYSCESRSFRSHSLSKQHTWYDNHAHQKSVKRLLSLNDPSNSFFVRFFLSWIYLFWASCFLCCCHRSA